MSMRQLGVEHDVQRDDLTGLLNDLRAVLLCLTVVVDFSVLEVVEVVAECHWIASQGASSWRDSSSCRITSWSTACAGCVSVNIPLLFEVLLGSRFYGARGSVNRFRIR